MDPPARVSPLRTVLTGDGLQDLTSRELESPLLVCWYY